MTLTAFEEDLQDLSSAENFLEHFKIPFDPKVVHVNRLHILQRFHDYLAQVKESLPESHDALFAIYQRLLMRAYQDFVTSDALTEKVFKVFHEAQAQTFVSIDSIGKVSDVPREGE